MVCTRVRMNFSWPKRKSVAKVQPDAIEPFQLQLSNRFSSLCETSDPEDIFVKITTGVLDTIKETLLLQNSSQCSWMSAKAKEAIDTKQKIRKQNGDKSLEYKIAKAESKKLVKKDRLKQVEEDIGAISSLPPHKQYYAGIKRLKSKPKDISWGVKDSIGNILTDKENILERWA